MSTSRLVTSASISNHHLIGYTRLLTATTCPTSDIVTVAESVLSLGAVTLALGVSFVWTAKEQTIKRSSVTD